MTAAGNRRLRMGLTSIQWKFQRFFFRAYRLLVFPRGRLDEFFLAFDVLLFDRDCLPFAIWIISFDRNSVPFLNVPAFIDIPRPGASLPSLFRSRFFCCVFVSVFLGGLIPRSRA